MTLRALLRDTAEGSAIAVAVTGAPRDDEVSDELEGSGRLLHPLRVDDAQRGAGPDPHDGQGPLDQLAVARMRGATHFLLPASLATWLRRYPDLADHLARRATLVATNPEGTLWAVPPPPPPGAPRTFCIGLNKTGTSSLHLALQHLGFRSYHWGSRPAYHAVLEAQRDGERLLHHVGEEYDAYGDIGTLTVRFDLADLQYPGSRFILTMRDVDDWMNSRDRHALRNLRDRRAGLYRGSNVQIDRELWRAQWDRHNDRVTGWFAGRDDLLVVDLCGGEGWERLAPFLGRPIPAAPFPHDNIDGGGSRWGLKPAWRVARRILPAGVADSIRSTARRASRRAPRRPDDPAGR